MKHIGLIAEYNPFHNGHQYQINQIKKQFPDKSILVIMSGDYVQRGEPAVYNKYLRTQCALYAGADIVIELPSLFATASAEHFASAGILSLAATGIVDTLCFGAENTSLEAFQTLASLFTEEPEYYQQLLKSQLKNGLSYPKARSLAAAAYLQDDSYTTLLKQPNNILGIEYLKAIKRYHVDIQPVVIKRTGRGYHDLSITSPLCSASALRRELSTKNPNLQQFMPAGVYNILTNTTTAMPLFLSDLYPFLQYALWQESDYRNYYEVTDELSNRLLNIHRYPSDIDKFIKQLSSKNLTETRIQRVLLNILLKHSNTDMNTAKKNEYISYLRLLGFRNTASPLLKTMKKSCMVPVINKVANAQKLLAPKSYIQFKQEINSSTLYQQAFYNKYGISLPSEYEHSVIITK